MASGASPSASWRRIHIVRSSRQMASGASPSASWRRILCVGLLVLRPRALRLSRAAIRAQQGTQSQCVQRVETSLFIGPSQTGGFSWHTGHSSVLFKFHRRSHSCLFSSRRRGVMSGRVSALEVVASGTTPCCLKLGATTCSMKPLALK